MDTPVHLPWFRHQQQPVLRSQNQQMRWQGHNNPKATDHSCLGEPQADYSCVGVNPGQPLPSKRRSWIISTCNVLTTSLASVGAAKCPTSVFVPVLASPPCTYCSDKLCRLHWLGHMPYIADGRIPKDILYGELPSGKWPKGRPQLQYKDICKHIMKALDSNTEIWEDTAPNRISWLCLLKKLHLLFMQQGLPLPHWSYQQLSMLF